jgi:RHS repeat-associated protein
MPSDDPVTSDGPGLYNPEAVEARVGELTTKGVDNLTPAERKELSEFTSFLMGRMMRQAGDEFQRAADALPEIEQSGGEAGTLSPKTVQTVLQQTNAANALEGSAYQARSSDGPEGVQQLADPVMMVNGQYVHTARDFTIKGAGLDFVFTRTYKNQTYYEGPLGVNWDHSYNLYLRSEFAGTVLVRASGELREDRYVLHTQHPYFVPPDGYHDVIIARDHLADYAGLLASCADDLARGHPYTFVLRTPAGAFFLYESLSDVNLHRIRKIRDRFGNFLRFAYDSQDRVRSVTVNHAERIVTFDYDDHDRIVSITLYGVSYPWRDGLHERVWRYQYDDFGDLIAVTSPDTQPYPPETSAPRVRGYADGLTTRYAYSTAEQVGELAHNLVQVYDAVGQVYLENSYGNTSGLLSFNRVVRQRQGHGQFEFAYEDTVSQSDWDYTPEEQPAHKTTFYERDGHPIELFYNRAGKLLVRRETISADPVGLRQLIWRFRYNADGALLASLSPEGRILQYYYGREDFYGRPLNHGDATLEPALDPTLTAEERLRFGNLLATIRRGTRYDFQNLVSALPDPDGFKDFFPQVLTQHDPSDIIQKWTYTADYQQSLTVSDPRVTTTADPRGVEPPEYDAQLTTFDYYAPPLSLLRRVRYPSTTFPERLPDGRNGLQGLAEEFLQYDDRGRVLESRDLAGGVTRRRYYPPAAGVRVGYLQQELRQQASLLLGAGALDTAAVRWSGGWNVQASYRLSEGGGASSQEIDFAGTALVLYQDTDGQTLHGDDTAVGIRLINAAGAARGLPTWDQTREPAYTIDDLPSGSYTVHLEPRPGALMSLGRADIFQAITNEVNEAGLITSTVNPRGQRSQTIVNELDQVIATIGPAPFSYETYTSYNPNGLVETSDRTLDPPIDGNRFQRTAYAYDTQNLLIAQTVGGDISGRLTTRHVNDASDRRIKTIMPRGNAIYYRYDERSLRVAVIRAACTCDEAITRAAYDGDGLPVSFVDPGGNETQYVYDAFRRVVRVVDALGHVLCNCYDKLGNLTSRFFFEKTDQGFALLARSANEYDELGRQRRLDATLFPEPIDSQDFDPRSDNLDPDDPSVFPAYTNAVANGRVSILRTDSYLDGKGRAFRIQRYGLLPPERITRQSARTRSVVVEQSFDSLDRLIRTRDDLGNYGINTYDPAGNIIRADTHEMIRDPATGALQFEEVFSALAYYDEVGRAKVHIDSLGNSTQLSYDSRGLLTHRKDPLGNVVRREYDVFGRLVRSIQELTPSGIADPAPPVELVTLSAYDENDNLLNVTNSRGAVTRRTYDAVDRLIQLRYESPDDRSYEAWQYDPRGLVRVHRDPNGLKRFFSYDALSRFVDMRLDASEVIDPDFLADALDDREQFVYDGLGRTVKASNAFATIEVDYDSLGRATMERWWYTPPPGGAVQPVVLERAFDVFSNLTRLTYPGGRVVIYEHDALNRVMRIGNEAIGNNYPGDPATPARYDIVRQGYRGLRIGIRLYGNGAGTRLTYDGARRVIALHHFGPSDTRLLEIQQLYDGAGNKRFEINMRPDPADPARTTVDAERYQYDSLYRLTSYRPMAQAPLVLDTFRPATGLLPADQLIGQTTINRVLGGLAQTAAFVYRYDGASNRYESREPGTPGATYSANLVDEYERIVARATGAVTEPRYDAAGNLLHLGTRRYHYDHAQRLTRVENQGQEIARLRYDPWGRLIVFVPLRGNEATYFVHDNLNLLAEFLAAPNRFACVAQYVNGRGPDGRYQLAAAGQELWYHTSVNRSVRLMTGARGPVVAYTYEPFGRLRSTLPAAGLPANAYFFSGRRLFPSLGVYDFRARTYLPDWGRFLQRDPQGTADSLNLYEALGDNPASFIDPLGTEKSSIASVEFEPTLIQVSRKPTDASLELSEWKSNDVAYRESVYGDLYNKYDDASTPEERARVVEEIKSRAGQEFGAAAGQFYLYSILSALAGSGGGLLGQAASKSLGLGVFGTSVATGIGGGAATGAIDPLVATEPVTAGRVARSAAFGAASGGIFGGLGGLYFGRTLSRSVPSAQSDAALDAGLRSLERAAQELLLEGVQLSRNNATIVTGVVADEQGNRFILGTVTGNDAVKGGWVRRGYRIAVDLELAAEAKGFPAQFEGGYRHGRSYQVADVHAEGVYEFLLRDSNLIPLSPAYTNEVGCSRYCRASQQAIDAVIFDITPH